SSHGRLPFSSTCMLFTATPHAALYSLSLHDALPISATRPEYAGAVRRALRPEVSGRLSQAAYETLAIVAYQQPVSRARIEEVRGDRKSTRLNSSHLVISYAVFCSKKKTHSSIAYYSS